MDSMGLHAGQRGLESVLGVLAHSDFLPPPRCSHLNLEWGPGGGEGVWAALSCVTASPEHDILLGRATNKTGKGKMDRGCNLMETLF